MKLKMHLRLKVILIVIQVCVIRALDFDSASEDTQISLQKSTLLNTDNLNFDNIISANKDDSIEDPQSSDKGIHDTLHKEIDKLINSIYDFVKRTKEDANLESVSTKKRQRRSDPPGFIPPDLERQIDDINNQISAMIKDVDEMRKQSDANDVKNLNELMGALESLQKQYDNEHRLSLSKTKNLQDYIDQSKCTIADYVRLLDRIKQDFEKRKTEEEQTLLRENIIVDIHSRAFDHALEGLSKLRGKLTSNVNYVVQKAYDNTAGNFDRILQFGDRSKIVPTSFAIYQALNYEMESNGHNDYRKILRLIKSLKENVIANAASSIQMEAESFTSILHNVAKSITAAELTNSLKNMNYDSLSKIFEDIYLNDPLLFSEVLRQVLSSVIDKIDTVKLVKFFESKNKYVEQSVLGYLIMFEIFKERNSLNQMVLVDLAFALKKAIKACEDGRLADALSVATRLKDDLPESLRNLAMAERICIKNVDMNEYLYTANNYFIDDWGRQVFTWRDQSRDDQANWFVQPNGDAYYIKNDKFHGYLYATDHDYDSYNRHVRTQFFASDKSLWTFEPFGDEMYIRNTHFDEYLYADYTYNYDDERRFVFSFKVKTKLADASWKIENCTLDCSGDDCSPLLVNKQI